MPARENPPGQLAPPARSEDEAAAWRIQLAAATLGVPLTPEEAARLGPLLRRVEAALL